MKEEDKIIIKDIDNKISILKKSILKGDLKIDKESSAIINMIKIKINELDSIVRLVKKDE